MELVVTFRYHFFFFFEIHLNPLITFFKKPFQKHLHSPKSSDIYFPDLLGFQLLFFFFFCESVMALITLAIKRSHNDCFCSVV